MPSTRLAYLFRRYFEKSATDAERAEFMSLLQDQSAEPELKALMERTWEHFLEKGIAPGELPHFTPDQSKDLLKNVLGAREALGSRDAAGDSPVMSDSQPVPRTAWDLPVVPGSPGVLHSLEVLRPPIRRMTWGRAVAAASILLLVLGGGAWWLSGPVTHPGLAGTAKPAGTLPGDVAPGGNKAMLILADGSKITLDSAQDGTLARQGNVQVFKLSGGRLAYQVQDNPTTQGAGEPGQRTPTTQGAGGPEQRGGATGPERAESISYNTIATPRGGQYQVVLPDGTKAWLNAASTLRFPTAFTGKNRVVELTGEGYFEVSKDPAHPFRVSIPPAAGETGPGTQIDVLGTHFNVMAYTEEGSVTTSLLEGSVRVTEATRSGLLTAGEQAGYSRESGDLKIGEADMEQAVAWKNGLFQFEGATIETVMRQVARWYNVQVQYKGKIPRHFSGLISRNATLSQVLKMLEIAGGATFQLEGNTISVIPV